nr:hypothetical protein [Rummeliibacillus sp. SL167]
MVNEEQELNFFYKSEEWWISRLYGEEKSYLLTRSKDSYIQEFRTAKELFENGMIDGKKFKERVPDLKW